MVMEHRGFVPELLLAADCPVLVIAVSLFIYLAWHEEIYIAQALM